MVDPWSYAKTSEFSHQAALFMWANMACRYGLYAANQPDSYNQLGAAAKWLEGYSDKVPQLKWLHAIHNQGHGDAIRGGKAKAEGVKAGVYDMFLPVPYFGKPSQDLKTAMMIAPVNYHGLYLELKVGSNRLSEKQNEFADDMREAGYATEVAWGWLEAREKILAYLQISA